MSSDYTMRWTPLPDEVGNSHRRQQNVMRHAKRLRLSFLKGAVLSKEELRLALSGEVDVHLHRRISDRIRVLVMLEDLSAVQISDLMWLSDHLGEADEEKQDVTLEIGRRSMISPRRSHAPLSAAPSAQNDKSAEFPANIVRE